MLETISEYLFYYSDDWKNKGDGLCEQGKYAEAVDCYDRALALDKNNKDAWNNKENAIEKFLHFLDCKVISLHQDNLPFPHYETAYFLGKQTNSVLEELFPYKEQLLLYKEQLLLYKEKLLLYREDKDWLNRKGNALCAQRKYGEAINFYDRALALDKNNKDVWNNKGNALDAQGKYAEAIYCYDRALALDKNNKDVCNNKGNALCAQGKYAEAINFYDRALALDKNNKDVCNNKGNALCALRKYAEAINFYDRALALDKNDKDVLNRKGNALCALRKYEEAIYCYDRALVLDKNNKDLWNNKGNALDAQGKYAEAIYCYDRALALDKNDKDVWNNKGNALDAQGKYAEAVDCYDRAFALGTNYKLAWKNSREAEECLKKKGSSSESVDNFDGHTEGKKRKIPINKEIPQQNMENSAVTFFLSEEAINFQNWYHPDICHYLLQLADNKAKCIRVIFHDANEGNNTQTFKNQFFQLVTLSNCLKRPALFVSKEPGADNHFICGLVKEGNLLLINPLGITTHKTCYQTLAELKQEKTIKEVWLSSNPLQKSLYEEEGLVSCGPIAIELTVHILINFTPERLDNFWAEQLKTDGHTTHDASGLTYYGINIQGLLPNTLKELIKSTDESHYRGQICAIRKKHCGQLQALPVERAENLHISVEPYLLSCKEGGPHQLVFNALITEKTLNDIDELPDYQLLKEEIDTQAIKSTLPEKAERVSNENYEILPKKDTFMFEEEQISNEIDPQILLKSKKKIGLSEKKNKATQTEELAALKKQMEELAEAKKKLESQNQILVKENQNLLETEKQLLSGMRILVPALQTIQNEKQALEQTNEQLLAGADLMYQKYHEVEKGHQEKISHQEGVIGALLKEKEESQGIFDKEKVVKKNKMLKTENERLKSQQQKLSENHETLKKDHTKVVQIKSELFEKNHQLQEECKSLREGNKSLGKRLESAENEKTEKDKEIEKLRKKLKETEADNQILKKENKQLKEKVERLEESIKSIEKSGLRHQKKINDLETRLQNMEAENSDESLMNKMSRLLSVHGKFRQPHGPSQQVPQTGTAHSHTNVVQNDSSSQFYAQNPAPGQ